MWFLHDGPPPHFSRAVRMWLHETFPERWIGRGDDAPVKWPPRSPDMNPLDFFFWGAMKAAVYKQNVDTEEQLWERIQNAANHIRLQQGVFERVRNSLRRRAEGCIQNNGERFEHLL